METTSDTVGGGESDLDHTFSRDSGVDSSESAPGRSGNWVVTGRIGNDDIDGLGKKTPQAGERTKV